MTAGQAIFAMAEYSSIVYPDTETHRKIARKDPDDREENACVDDTGRSAMTGCIATRRHAGEIFETNHRLYPPEMQRKGNSSIYIIMMSGVLLIKTVFCIPVKWIFFSCTAGRSIPGNPSSVHLMGFNSLTIEEEEYLPKIVSRPPPGLQM